MGAFTFGLGISWSAAIGIGWLIAILCLIKKYDPEKKICSVSDAIKLTFSALTLWLVGSIFLSLTVQPQPYVSLAEQLAPLSDLNEIGVLVPPDDPIRLAAYEKIVTDWASPIWFSTSGPVSDANTDIEPTFVIVGTKEIPLIGLCFLSFASDFVSERGANGSVVQETPVRYTARCQDGEQG